jgi:hypothetical protein
MRAAIWPDWVRSNHPGTEPEATAYNRPPDHYINLPLIKPADKDRFNETKLRDGLPKDNILAALERHAKVIGSDAKAAEKAVSLCWLLHLMGDLHQPLHAVSFYSRDFPEGDRGGNQVGVTTDKGAMRLHAYWDDLMGSDPPADYDKRDNVEYQTQMFKLVQEATERLRDPQYGREKFAEQLGKTKFADWAEESRELAKTAGYENGDLKFAVIAFSAPVPKEAPKLSADYDKKAHEVGHRRVALASHRMADRLKELLAKP